MHYSIPHLNMDVIKNFPKLMLKQSLAGDLLELTVNCPKCDVLFRTTNEPYQLIYSHT